MRNPQEMSDAGHAYLVGDETYRFFGSAEAVGTALGRVLATEGYYRYECLYPQQTTSSGPYWRVTAHPTGAKPTVLMPLSEFVLRVRRADIAEDEDFDKPELEQINEAFLGELCTLARHGNLHSVVSASLGTRLCLDFHLRLRVWGDQRFVRMPCARLFVLDDSPFLVVRRLKPAWVPEDEEKAVLPRDRCSRCGTWEHDHYEDSYHNTLLDTIYRCSCGRGVCDRCLGKWMAENGWASDEELESRSVLECVPSNGDGVGICCPDCLAKVMAERKRAAEGDLASAQESSVV